MEQTLTANVTYLPTAQPGQDAGEAKNSGFGADFTLAGFWPGFSQDSFSFGKLFSGGKADGLASIDKAVELAEDKIKQEKKRKKKINEFFSQEQARNAVADYLATCGNRPLHTACIKAIAMRAMPGQPVNLRELESSVCEEITDASNRLIRDSIIPLLQKVGFIMPRENAGWRFADMGDKPKLDIAKKALLMVSPAHRELVDEQARRYALHLQEKALKQRLMQEKANQQLILQVQGKAEENEKAMIELGMKQTVSNTPAWIAGGVVALLAAAWLVGNGHPANPQPEVQAAAYEQAPAYTGGAAGAAPAPQSPEDILRQQYRIAHMDWDKLPEATRNNILKEFAEQQATMAATQGTAQGAGQ